MDRIGRALALFRDGAGRGEAALVLRHEDQVLLVRIGYGRSSDILRRIEVRHLAVAVHPARWIQGCGAARDCACRKLKANLQRDGAALDLEADIINPWCQTGRWNTEPGTGREVLSVRLVLASGAGIHIAQFGRALRECLRRIAPGAGAEDAHVLAALGASFTPQTLLVLEAEGEVVASALFGS